MHSLNKGVVVVVMREASVRRTYFHLHTSTKISTKSTITVARLPLDLAGATGWVMSVLIVVKTTLLTDEEGAVVDDGLAVPVDAKTIPAVGSYFPETSKKISIC